MPNWFYSSAPWSPVAQWVNHWLTDLGVASSSAPWDEIFSTINGFHFRQPFIISLSFPDMTKKDIKLQVIHPFDARLIMSHLIRIFSVSFSVCEVLSHIELLLINAPSPLFISSVRKYRELLLSLWCQGWCHTSKFYIKDLYVMGKALSGELSCMGTALVFCKIVAKL